MDFDASQLKQQGAPVLGQKIVWDTPGWPSVAKTWTAPFTGVLKLTVANGRTMALSGSLIDSITLGPKQAEIVIVFDSPVPQYRPPQPALDMKLAYRSNAWQIQFGRKWERWFKYSAQVFTYAVGLNQWIQGPGVMPEARDTQLPFGDKGIRIALPGAYFPSEAYVQAGIFLGAGDRPFVVVLPVAACNRATDNQSAGLRLDGLDTVELGGDQDIGDWTNAPGLLYLPLDVPAGRPGWNALVHWAPLGGNKPSRHDRLQSGDLFENAWNQVVRTLLQAHRSNQGAQPWLPLPVLSRIKGAPEATPILKFGIQPSAPGAPALAQAYLPSGTTRSFAAQFDWQAGAVLDREFAQPGALAGTALRFELTPTNPGRPWSTGQADMASLLDMGSAAHSDPSVLANWQFAVESASRAAPGSAWLTLGSLEFALPEASMADAQKGSALECTLRGVWNEGQRDLYPDVKLSFTCRVRVSASADPGQRNLNAGFDAADAAEEALHRDTEPLRHALNADSGRLCQLTIRHTSAPGSNAVVAMEVRSLVRERLGGDALYFQARPFVFAKVHAVDIDDLAGALIAVWRSDDADGVQWRMPDTTLSFELPPQAVGEEMERGNRFWPDAGSYITPGQPLRYRFAPPTRVVVQPSVLARRYDKNPSNLAEALRGAKVRSFVTEMAYPLSVSFTVSDLAEPDIRIAETAAFLGHTAVNLPLAAQLPERSRLAAAADQRWIADDAARWAGAVLSSEFAAWAAVPDGKTLGPHWPQFVGGYRMLRSAHSATQATFAARLGQFHLYDPWRKDGGLHLREGLKFRLRGTREHAPALLNPLPTRRQPAGGAGTVPAPVDLLPKQKETIGGFLRNGEWGDAAQDGALRAGVLHSIEFASELVSVLRSPESTTGSIDTLAFTALGASGQFSAAFDEGRATFIAETQHGQLSRLIKVRIGRIALLWNRAKHVTVYERTTVPSEQFKDEQDTPLSLGWPILRKTEEYVEPIDLVREFAVESQKDSNATGFVEASEFVSRRIYVNGAWGRDLGHGYELPLWDRADTSAFYPKPQLALRMHAGGGNRSRCWLDQPEHLFFYSNTEEGAGGDPDAWDAKPEVDGPLGLARIPVLTGQALKPADYLDAPAVPAPRPGGARRPRFDLATVSDGKANLQHARGDTEMLATLDLVSLSRTDETGAAAPSAALKAVQQGSDLAAGYAAVEQRLRSMLERLPRQMLESGLDCRALEARLTRDIEALFSGLHADLRALPSAPLAGMAAEWADSVQKEVMRNLGEWEFGTASAIQQVFERLLKDLKVLQEAALQAADQNAATLLAAARGRLRQLVQETRSVLAAALVLFDNQRKRLAQLDLSAIPKALDEVETALDALDTLPDPFPSTQLDQLARQLELLGQRVAEARRVPALAPVAARAAGLLDQVAQLMAAARALPAVSARLLTRPLRALVRKAGGGNPAGTLRAIFETGLAMVAGVSTAVDSAIAHVNQQHTAWATETDALLARLDTATALSELRAVLKDLVTQVEARLAGDRSALLQQLRDDVKAVRDQIEAAALPLRARLTELAGSVDSLARSAQAEAGAWLDRAKADALKLVLPLDCTALEQARARIDGVLGALETRLRDQVTGALGGLADVATRERLEQLNALPNKIGKGIKLCKAIGELPALPTLSFNAERAEYVFDDLKKQIDTSPFAARLREIDSGLKELGLAIPTRQLLDQLVPDNLQNLDFNRIFKNLGGMDFQDFFKRFRLPELPKDKIKITHGVDQATRSAWVTTAVNADFPEEQALFEFSSMALRVARMRLRANSDIRISADGQRRAVTDGRFSGDWGLDFGGTRMATFQDVTVSFDGNGFNFDMSPDKVQLHPSLKFIQDYAKQFEDALPPAIQLEKDARGIPVGARASFVTLIDKLPPIPPVTIGPILIASGLGLRMARDGKFEVSTHVSLGSKSAPVFVQVSYLGGGFWLEARCTARGSQIVPQASLGLALGSMRAFTLAGVARGSYSILLFASAEIDGSGGALRAGLSIAGSARILGIANASLDLLLEVEHHSGGGTTARGWLNVQIKICWCYTLRVSTSAQHKL